MSSVLRRLTSERCSEPACELGARAHVELRVDVRQVGCKRALPEEERRRDLAVRLSFRNELRDPALALRQLAVRARPASDPAKLGASLVGPEGRGETLEH